MLLLIIMNYLNSINHTTLVCSFTGLLNVIYIYYPTMNIIETERLLIREFTEDDVEEFGKIITDKETMKFFPSPYKKGDVIKWIRFCIESYRSLGHSFWAVIRKKDNRFLGDCGITIQSIDGEKLPEVGYHFNKEFWGKGYATEAAKACIEYGFKNFNYPSLYSYMTKDNTPSQCVAKRAGMEFVKEFTRDNLNLVVYNIDKNL